MAGALESVEKSVKMSNALTNATNQAHASMSKLASISFDAVTQSLSRLADVMKTVGTQMVEVSMKTDVQITTLKKYYENQLYQEYKAKQFSDEDAKQLAVGLASGRARNHFKLTEELRANSLLDEQDIYKSVLSAKSLKTLGSDDHMRGFADIASGTETEMQNVISVFKQLENGDYFRGIQGAVDLGIDKDELKAAGFVFDGPEVNLSKILTGDSNMSDQEKSKLASEKIYDMLMKRYSGMAGARASTLPGTFGTIQLRLEQMFRRMMGFEEDGETFRPDSLYAKLLKAANFVEAALRKASDLDALVNPNSTLNIWEKLGAIMMSLKDQFSNWWYSGGWEIVQQIAHDMGEALGKGITAIFSSGLDSDKNVFVSLGLTIAKGLWEGFVDGFDLKAIMDSTFGKIALTLGAGWLGTLIAGPGGGLLAGAIAGGTANVLDGKGIDFGAVFDGLVNGGLMGALTNLATTTDIGLDSLFDLAMPASLLGVAALEAGTQGKIFDGGLFKGFKELFKKDVNYPKEISGKMDVVSNHLSTIVGHLQTIIDCVCQQCNCEETTGGGKKAGNQVDAERKKVEEDEGKKAKKKGKLSKLTEPVKNLWEKGKGWLGFGDDADVEADGAKAGKNSAVKTAAKKGLRRVTGISTAMSVLDIFKAEDKAGATLKAAGSGLGGWGGAAAGAALGTAIFPGVGTVVGGLIGGIAGSWGGEKIGEFASKKLDTEGFTARRKVKRGSPSAIGTGGLAGDYRSSLRNMEADTSGFQWSLTNGMNSTFSSLPMIASPGMMGLQSTVGGGFMQMMTSSNAQLSGLGGMFGNSFKLAGSNAVTQMAPVPGLIGGMLNTLPGLINTGGMSGIGAGIMLSIAGGLMAALAAQSPLVQWLLGAAVSGIAVSLTAGGTPAPGNSVDEPEVMNRRKYKPFKQYHGGGLVEDEGFAILKRKEMVLDENLSSFIRSSAAQTTGQRSGGGGGPVSIQIGALANTLHVREEADIQNIAAALSNELQRVLGNQGAHSMAEVAK